MDNVYWLLGAIGLWVAVVGVDLVKGWRKGRLRFTVKKVVNEVRWLVHLIFVGYFLILNLSHKCYLLRDLLISANLK